MTTKTIQVPAKYCLICRHDISQQVVLRFESLAICNDFNKVFPALHESHPLEMTECSNCKLVQLTRFPATQSVRPKVDWIKYNEPEKHLDQVASHVRTLPSLCIKKQITAIGIGPFDSALLGRLPQQFYSTTTLDLTPYIQKSNCTYPYLESIQEILIPNNLKKLATRQDRVDLICCRYLLEHSHQPLEMLEGLKYLLNEDGYLLVEVPDSEKFIASKNYSFIWEEHILYFTEHSMKACALQAGYEICHFSRYPGSLEDALVFILKISKNPIKNNNCFSKNKINSSNQFANFANDFDNYKKQYQNLIKKFINNGKKIAIYGIGHQSVMFINMMEIQNLISYAIDDAPHKQGLFVPGTNLVINSSSELLNDASIKICLMGIQPSSELKLSDIFSSYIARGGNTYSIYPNSITQSLFHALQENYL